MPSTSAGLSGRREGGTPALPGKDAASGAAWYPQIVVDTPRTTAPLLTAERVEEEYVPPWIYETEAAGFFLTACRFSTVELVHCFKVISDNPETTLTRRTSAAFIQGLIEEHLEGITGFAVALAGLAREVEALAADPPGYREALERRGDLQLHAGRGAAVL